MKKNYNSYGKDVSKIVNNELKMSAKSPIDVHKETELASETKSYCVSLPENMNNKNSVCKLVTTYPKKYISLGEKRTRYESSLLIETAKGNSPN